MMQFRAGHQSKTSLIDINVILCPSASLVISQERWKNPMRHFTYITQKTGFLAVPLLAVAALIGTSFGAVAQEAGDVEAGHKLAGTWCSDCHIVGPEQQHGTSTGAPTFSAIANMKTTTQMGLHAFLQTPHSRMPDLHLNQDEIDDVATYIVSLRQSAGR
jgi:mono/diheme cytochrome c family protein